MAYGIPKLKYRDPLPIPGCGANISRAAIHRRDSILAWIVILSVYGTDTIAEVIDLSLSALIS
jgi:hypothetical protein